MIPDDVSELQSSSFYGRHCWHRVP